MKMFHFLMALVQKEIAFQVTISLSINQCHKVTRQNKA